MSKKLTIGLFGFGVVGQGLHDIIKTKNLNIEIVKIYFVLFITSPFLIESEFYL